MNIIVCIKQTPDHEGPRESYVINSDLNVVEPSGIPPVMSLFDENALEGALRIKDNIDDVKITVVSIGERISNAIMMRSLAAGADELIKVEDKRFASHLLDSRTTACILVEILDRIGSYDLVLLGRQSSDWNNGYMGIALGNGLNIPCITFAQEVDIQSGDLIINRVLDNGHEIVRLKFPAVVMVSNELGGLRYPAMKARREAKKKPIQAWSGNDIQLEQGQVCKLELKELYYPEMKATDCSMIDGDSLGQAGAKLAQILLEKRIFPIQ